MPLFNYLCECKESVKKFYRQAKDAPSIVPCKCGKESKRILSVPSNASIVVVDNGLQAKRTEVNLEIVESIKERSTKDFHEE